MMVASSQSCSRRKTLTRRYAIWTYDLPVHPAAVHDVKTVIGC
ncbi:hypothetical protein B0G80_2117 [Paraburkholderia sp. BL6669N2]|nr:hypothetical protein B0G80_2117 [Paraburkholderia sp. BL6669N2]